MATKKNPYIGADAAKHIRAEMAADPVLAAGVQAELERLAIAGMVKQARLDAKLTQAELAEKADTAQAVIARMEHGKIPKLELLTKIATALGHRLEVRLVPNKTTARGKRTKPVHSSHA
jgi:ribosome-binding protein aMBF1 (putative translation factor)